ncbi:hypothetical protein LINPERHAP1_LOCUS27981, partial [Linum perenne]
INVLAVCNQNLQFTYCLAGWEGSAHDSRVLRDALSRAGGFRVPEGNRPRTPEEYFNMKHASARNVIEKAFGILKNACILLHNFIRKEGGVDVFEMAYVPPAEEEETFVESIDEPAAYVEPTEEWTQFRHHLAEYMWANRGR